MIRKIGKYINARRRLIFILACFACMTVAVTATYAQLVFEEEAKKPLKKKTKENPNTQFFKSCKQRYFDVASFSIMETYCICTTAHQYEYRKSRAGKYGGDFLGNSSTAPIYSDDMAVQIEAPCFYILANDLAYKRCKRDPQYDKYVPKNVSKNKICNCIADLTEQFFEEAAQPLISAKIKRNNKLMDDHNIMEVLMTDSDYTRQLSTYRNECFQKYSR